MSEKYSPYKSWLPQTEPQSPRGRELQAEWLTYQVDRLSLGPVASFELTRKLANAWDNGVVKPKEIKDWIDSQKQISQIFNITLDDSTVE